MTTSRDPDRLIQAFLEEGPNVLTDRVHDAIRDDIDHIDQRAGVGPWRSFIMSRPILAAAIVAIAVVGGLAIYTVVRLPDLGIGNPSPTPLAFPADGDLTIGTTYRVGEFSEPVLFAVPDSMSDGRLAGDFDTAQGFRVNDFTYGVATFHDDQNIVDDVCNPSVLTTIPTTPEAVGSWLSGSNGATVFGPTAIAVDGRTALAWDVELGDSCVSDGDVPVPGAAFWFQANEHHRIYAIPTGDDTILAVTWGNEFGGAGEEFLDQMNAASDDLVRSMDFE
jgi:hypothetical protein